MKIRKEFKDDMKFWSGVLFTGLVISCIYYSYCKFLIETIGLPSLRSNLEQQGDFEIMVSATLYTVVVYIIIMLVIGIVKAVRRIVDYIFE